MADPYVHAKSSAKKFGGKPEDYYKIHAMMDSSKGAYASNAHRAIFHHSFGSSVIIPAIFGPFIVNSDGKEVSTKDVAEQHILEDFGMRFIPTIQDYFEHLQFQEWMNGGRHSVPSSCKPLSDPARSCSVN